MNLKAKIKKIISRKEYTPIICPVSEKKELNNKVALISGGTGGIGLAIAKSLRESGCDVVVAGTNRKKLASLEIEGFDTVVMDYSEPDLFNDVIKKIVEDHKKLDIFISSAGVHTENVDFWTMSSNEFDRVMDINLKGTFFACQAVGNYMRESGIKGSILLVSSSRGTEPAWSPYGLSKWGINGLTKGLAKIFSSYSINVNSIAPGSTATSLIGVKEGDSISSNENKYGRLVMPEEVATIAKMLVSDAGKMIDGEVVHVAAGRGTFEFR